MKKKLSSKEVFLYSKRFLALKNPMQLAWLLKTSPQKMESVIADAKYHSFEIPKKTGGKREILSPSDNVKELQRELNVFLQCICLKFCNPVAHGFFISISDIEHSPGISTNAKNHLGKVSVMNIDIESFFHSITTDQVRKIFASSPFSFSEDLATCLALLCCYQKKLPVGAPTSPAISNLMMVQFDNEMEALCLKHSSTYTRYADDLTISSNEKFDEKFIEEIKSIITNSGFKINKKKFRVQSNLTKQLVTGLKVNEKLNVDRKYIRNIRATLHDLKLNGWDNAAKRYYKVHKADPKLIHRFLLSVKGKIDFIGGVKGKDDGVYVGLCLKWKGCF